MKKKSYTPRIIPGLILLDPTPERWHIVPWVRGRYLLISDARFPQIHAYKNKSWTIAQIETLISKDDWDILGRLILSPMNTNILVYAGNTYKSLRRHLTSDV